MPEIMPIFDSLRHITHDDPTATQFLSLYQPPAYLINCSQAVFINDEPMLIRNYDLSPDLSENTLFLTNWLDRKIISTNEYLWGVDDGMNDTGLAISLTFGGRKNLGDGFGIPIILRYVLQTCETVSQAIKELKRIPSHMSYNVTVMDKTKNFATVMVAPDREAIVTKDQTSTNHQQKVEWEMQATFSKTIQRKTFLDELVKNKQLDETKIADAFLQAPLHSNNYDQNFGTVYTAVYKPLSGVMSYHWPSDQWQHSFHQFNDEKNTLIYEKKKQRPINQIRLFAPINNQKTIYQKKLNYSAASDRV